MNRAKIVSAGRTCKSEDTLERRALYAKLSCPAQLSYFELKPIKHICFQTPGTSRVPSRNTRYSRTLRRAQMKQRPQITRCWSRTTLKDPLRRMRANLSTTFWKLSKIMGIIVGMHAAVMWSSHRTETRPPLALAVLSAREHPAGYNLSTKLWRVRRGRGVQSSLASVTSWIFLKRTLETQKIVLLMVQISNFSERAFPQSLVMKELDLRSCTPLFLSRDVNSPW